MNFIVLAFSQISLVLNIIKHFKDKTVYIFYFKIQIHILSDCANAEI